MFGVVAKRRRPDVVQLVSVKSPLADETLGQLFVICLHLGHCRAERHKGARHPGGLPIFVEDQPIRMLLHDVRDTKLSPSVAVSSILYAQRQPPDLYLDSLIVKLANHVRDRVASKRRLMWFPVAIIF